MLGSHQCGSDWYWKNALYDDDLRLIIDISSYENTLYSTFY